jgi:tetraacyldisaccharide 4'-kinase
MKLNKPKFWDRKIGLLSILLLPFTLLVLIFIFFKKKFSSSKVFNIPIICIGNIYIGGTGKTPTSILLAKELSNLGINPVILRKYYKDQTDEYALIKNSFDNLILSKNRTKGLNEAENQKYDLAILDDGLQEYKIKKNLSIVCFNSNQLIGNGLVLPSGPLRDVIGFLKNVDIVLIIGEKNINFEKKILKVNNNLEIYYSSYKLNNINQFENKKLLAIAGIGNPENFFQLVEKKGLTIEKKLIFPDHYIFSKSEIENIIMEANNKNLTVVMTEKDYFKIKEFNLNNLHYLKVSLEIEKKEKLIKKIITLHETD